MGKQINRRIKKTNVGLIAVFLLVALTVTSASTRDINGGVDHVYSHGYNQGNQHGYYDVKYLSGMWARLA